MFHLYNIVQVLLLNYRLLITIVDGRTHCKRIIFAEWRRHTHTHVTHYGDNLISTLDPGS